MKCFIFVCAIAMVTVISIASVSWGQADDEQSRGERLDPGEWKEVHSIIDDIKRDNPDTHWQVEVGIGETQIAENWPDAIDLGQGGSIPTFEGSLDSDLWRGFGVHIDGMITMNTFPDSSSVNGSGSYGTWIFAGPEYTIYFDDTHKENFLRVGLFWHHNDFNFSLEPSETSVPNLFVNHFGGYGITVKRGVQLSPHLGILANIDLIYLNEVGTLSSINPDDFGYGVRFKGEVYYRTLWHNRPLHLGFSYAQQADETRLNDSDQTSYGRTSYFQITRGYTITVSTLF